MSTNEQEYRDVKGLADLFHVTPATVRRWISRGLFKSIKSNGRYVVDINSDETRQFLLDQLGKIGKRRAKTWTPQEIRQFSTRHEVLDELAWLIKTSYTHPIDIRRKRFRLDQMFANYLRSPKLPTLKAIARVFDPNVRKRIRLVTDDLKRGWYNELAYQYPPRPSTLTFSFSDMELNKPVSSSRFAFPSWRITQAYYATYFYLRGVCLQKTDAFRLEEHNATVSTFKHSVQKPLEKLLWRFPLSVTFEPGVTVDRSQLLIGRPEFRYAYFRYPRDNRTPRELFNSILAAFRANGRRGKRPSSYSLFDYLRDFRIWANYQNIDDLLNLYGSGYKAFLDQNLAMLLFFVGGVAELCYIACFSPAAYVSQLQSLYDLFASNNPELKRDFHQTPLMQRLGIYRALGIVSAEVVLQQEEDVNAIHVTG